MNGATVQSIRSRMFVFLAFSNLQANSRFINRTRHKFRNYTRKRCCKNACSWTQCRGMESFYHQEVTEYVPKAIENVSECARTALIRYQTVILQELLLQRSGYSSLLDMLGRLDHSLALREDFHS